MARPKLYDSDRIIGLVEDYFVNAANGDPCMLKFSRIEKYLNDNGMNVKAYNLRRDTALLKKIEELKRSACMGYERMTEASYKNLDIEEFIRRAYDLNSLRKALLEMDEYWKEVYYKSDAAAKENKKLLGERSGLLKENKELLDAVEELKGRVEELERDGKRIGAENAYLRGQVKKYIYPAAADVLLEKMNLPKNKESGIVDVDAVKGLIDEGTPKPFDGIQKKTERKVSREEGILAEMKRMVEE